MIIYIINGPNLNLLGVREPEVYGNDTYETLTQKIRAHCELLGIDAVIYQSNHEGDLVDKIHEAYTMGAEGIVINPAAYTHTTPAFILAETSPRMETERSDTHFLSLPCSESLNV